MATLGDKLKAYAKKNNVSARKAYLAYKKKPSSFSSSPSSSPSSSNNSSNKSSTNNSYSKSTTGSNSSSSGNKKVPTTSEQLKYYTNKLDYNSKGSVSPEQSKYNQSYRSNYGIDETNDTTDELQKKIENLQDAINKQKQEEERKAKEFNPVETVEDVFGVTKEGLQEDYKNDMTTEINAKYMSQVKALEEKLKSLQNIYQQQRKDVIPEYEQTIDALRQDEADKEFRQREHLNRIGGTVAQGLQADLGNKLKRTMLVEQAKAEANRDSKLNEILTNQANDERETLSLISELSKAKDMELGTVDSKAYDKALKTYSDLMDNAIDIDEMAYNRLSQEEINTLTIQAKKLEIRNAEIEEEALKIERDFKLSPEYKQSLYDTLKFEKEKNEQTIAEIKSRINSNNALATQRLTKDEPELTKDQAYSQIYAKLKSLKVPEAFQALKNPKVQAEIKANGINVETMWNDVMKEALMMNTPGVFAYKDWYKIED